MSESKRRKSRHRVTLPVLNPKSVTRSRLKLRLNQKVFRKTSMLLFLSLRKLRKLCVDLMSRTSRP